MSGSVLTYAHVDIAYGGRTAVRDVSFELPAGRILGIVGESGSGKSTIVRAAMGLLGRGGRVSAGEIVCDGTDVLAASPRELRAMRGVRAGMVFQDCLAALTPTRRIGDQVHEAMAAHGAIERAESDARACELLARLNLDDPARVLASYPFELSGGMGQRVGVAMALLLEPSVLLLDEPTSALDVCSQKRLIAELLDIRARQGCAMAVVTHNIGVVRALADEVLVLRDGEVAEQGPTCDVLRDPKTAYTRRLIEAVPRLEGRSASKVASASDARPCAARDDGRAGSQEAACGRGPVVLDVRDLRKAFSRRGLPDTIAVDGIDFQVHAGECVGLVGESGSGKSTAAGMVMRMVEASGGQVLLGRCDVLSLRGRGIRELYRDVQMVFQNPTGSFDPRRTLGEGIAEGARNLRGASRADAAVRAAALLERCGLPAHLADRHAREVSGGQCQRAAIARALAVGPRLLVLDEATSALDATAQKQVLELLGDLRRETGMAMLFICHDIALTQAVCDTVLVMRRGRIVERGTPDEIVSDPQHPYTRQLIESVL